jgi:hypothetical protein
MPGSEKDPLRELLKRELDAFSTDSTGADANISPGRIEMLNNLAKLVETRDSLQPRPRNWWPPLILAGTLIIVSVLLFGRVRETDIELEISVAQLDFELEKSEVLSSAANLSMLGVSGIKNVRLPQSDLEESISSSNGQVTVLSLAALTLGTRRGNVTLAPLVLPAHARVRLNRSEVANQYNLSTNVANLRFEAAAYGPVTIRIPGSPEGAFDFATPRQIVMQGGTDEVSLDLTFPSLPQSVLSSQLEVRDMGFARVDQFLGPDQTLVKHLSTILSGTLFFESLNGQPFTLRPGEQLNFEHSQGEIRALELGANYINLKYHGRVAGMTAGTGEGRRSIMPTYLEWLKARHGLSLLWATSLYLFGLAAAALRWFGVKV